MTDRDWDKELAKVDKQLAALPEDAGPPPVPAAGGARPPAAPGATPAATPSAAVETPSAAAPHRTSGFGVYARLTLSVALGVAMTVWPYEARCGIGLAGYLAAVGVVILSGVWSSIWTWRHRAGRAHVLSMLLILWGLILGSQEVLPRVGYARTDLRHPGVWVCP